MLRQVCIQIAHRLLPIGPIRIQPSFRQAQRTRRQSDAVDATIDRSGNEPRAFQYPEMLGIRGQRHGEWFRQVGDTYLPHTESGKQSTTGAVR